MHNQIASFRAALDARPVSRYQWLLLLLLALLLVTDGYDAQVLGYVVPTLAQEWGLDKAAFGPVFSANLFGLTVGSLLVTPLADRFGIRRVLLCCVLIYASLTVLMVFAGSLESLMLARFVCGIGMGGAMPSAMALMAEYSPPRLRTLMVTLAACGFSFGGAAGGFVAAAFMDGFGWQAVFLAGGVTPLLLFPFLLLFLPESLPRLLRDAPPYARLRQLSERMAPGWQPPPAQADAEPAASLTVLELFRHGYARPTLLLWATFFVSLILLYFMVSWLPSLLQESGLTRNAANLATSMFLFAGTLGAMLLAWLADRLRSKVRLLAAILAGAALFTLLLGLNHDQPRWLLAFVFAAGFCIIGGQLTLNAFASNFYPAQVRATGTGWALGVGRFGSILGPLFGSLLLGMHISVENIFMLAAIPAGLAALLILQVRSPAAQAQRESAAALPFRRPPQEPPMNDADSLQDYQRVRQQAIRSLFEIVEGSSEGTVIVDREARIVWINQRYAQRFGLADPAQAIGRPCESVIPGSLLREVVGSGKPILLDMMDSAKDPLVVMRLPIHDDAGEVIGAIGFALLDELRSLSPLVTRYLSMQRELASTRSQLQARQAKYSFSHFVGTSPASLEVKRRARRGAASEAPVLLLGETGTGKELLAHAIHSASPRAHKAFVSVNAAAIPESLLEAEFFGTAPGAFTGAERKGRPGKLQVAQGGTLFLDEIGDMPLALQGKLLRVLQEKEFEAVGSNEVIRSDIRLVAATSIDLQQAMREGRFRADLYYRLNVLPIEIPPLRQRLDDLPALCESILDSLDHGRLHELGDDALALLARHAWPGNVRELRNVLERALLLADQPLLDAAALGAALGPLQPLPELPRAADDRPVGDFQQAREAFERDLIGRALAQSAGNVVEAAKRLGLGRSTLYKKIVALGIRLDNGTRLEIETN
ncbi:hypothetical protein APA39_33050 [Pseudomonas aeruginosa]|nr:hypothetical protein APA39_33050 [Pseudomonas aeruginosa]